MKNTKNPKTAFTASEVGVLIEDLRGQFQIFGENMSSIKIRLDSLFDELGKQKEDIFIIKTDVRVIKAGIAEIKDTIKNHDKRIAHLETSTK